MGSSCHPRGLVRQELSSKVGVWGFLPTTHPCLSPNPLLDCVTSLAFSAWNLALTAVAISGVLGTALDTAGSHSLFPSMLLLPSRQTRRGSLKTRTRVLEVLWRPQVCRGWTETGGLRGRRERGVRHLCLSPGSSWGLLALCCVVTLLVPWVVGMAEGQRFALVEGLFPAPLQVSLFCLIPCPPQHHTCHHSVLQGYHGSRRGRWRGGLRG